MAKKDNEEKELEKKENVITGLLSNIQKAVSNLYKNTYFNSSNSKDDLDIIKSNIDSSIDNILNNNMSSVGIPNISKLYTRMTDFNNDNKIDETKNIGEDIFNDKTIADSFLNTMEQNRMVVEYDEEIDTILKYMPQLEDALDAKKDNVLSADQYSKDYINTVNESNISNVVEYENRIKYLKSEYNLLELFDSVYDKTARYGEDFLYIVPFKKAIKQILNSRDGLSLNNTISESAAILESAIDDIEDSYAIINLNESTIYESDGNKQSYDIYDDENMTGEIKVNFNTSGFIKEVFKNRFTGERVLKTINEAKFDKKIIPDNTEFDSASSTDGFINTDKKSNTDEITAPGCIIKRLNRENVIPVYIEDLCLGFYYIECKDEAILKGRIGLNDPLLGMNTNKLKVSDDMSHYNKTLNDISGRLSKIIDAKFINANYDLKKELYAILKHSYSNLSANVREISVTYISPEDMHHSYFKLDPKTHRGISDLHKSLVPAKFWVSLSTTSAVGVMTRGYDRRVYYVKQNVDTNISQTLLNTINQIKKANFGTREFASIKNVLNITGRYNDMVMPLNSSGDAPIQFEIMPGQNIDVKTELMDMYEKSAIEATDIPFEYVSSRGQTDFAIRLTMSNGKFLRYSFKRQAQYEPFMSRVMTKLYNGEYEENDNIRVNLPAPMFLNIVNTTQMMDSMDQYADKITNMILDASDSDTFRAKVKNSIMSYYLNNYVDMGIINEIKNKAKIESDIEEDKMNNSNN